MATERLQKIMAACGVASRRKAEEMIASGRVTLNGAVVTELGTKADAVRDHGQRSGRTPDGDGADEKMPGARVSRGAAGLCQRRLAVDDERRSAGAEVDEGGFARTEDLFGENQWEAGGEGHPALASGNYDCAGRWEAGEDVPREDSPRGRWRQSLVRGDSDRRAQSADSENVSASGI